MKSSHFLFTLGDDARKKKIEEKKVKQKKNRTEHFPVSVQYSMTSYRIIYSTSLVHYAYTKYKITLHITRRKQKKNVNSSYNARSLGIDF